jgi:hypothetical protein
MGLFQKYVRKLLSYKPHLQFFKVSETHLIKNQEIQRSFTRDTHRFKLASQKFLLVSKSQKILTSPGSQGKKQILPIYLKE